MNNGYVRLRELLDGFEDGRIRILNIYVSMDGSVPVFSFRYTDNDGYTGVGVAPDGYKHFSMELGGLRMVRLRLGEPIWLHEGDRILYNSIYAGSPFWCVYRVGSRGAGLLGRVRASLLVRGFVGRGSLRTYIRGRPRIDISFYVAGDLDTLLKILLNVPRPIRLSREAYRVLVDSCIAGGVDIEFIGDYSMHPLLEDNGHYIKYLLYNSVEPRYDVLSCRIRYRGRELLIGGRHHLEFGRWITVGEPLSIGSYIYLSRDRGLVCRIVI